MICDRISVPANTRHWYNVRLKLGQRRTQWDRINPALYQCLVFGREGGERGNYCALLDFCLVLFKDGRQLSGLSVRLLKSIK